MDKSEPLLKENDKRFVLFPIQYGDIWGAYKDNSKNFWLCENLVLTDCLSTIPKSDQIHIERILSFWTNYSEQQILFRLSNDIQVPEARCFLGYQIYNQINHREFFSRLLRGNRYRPVSRLATDAVRQIFDREAFGGRLVAYSTLESVCVSSLHVLRRLLRRQAATRHLVPFVDLVLQDKRDCARFGAVLLEHCVSASACRYAPP